MGHLLRNDREAIGQYLTTDAAGLLHHLIPIQRD
jgi:hypothetical protein